MPLSQIFFFVTSPIEGTFWVSILQKFKHSEENDVNSFLYGAQTISFLFLSSFLGFLFSKSIIIFGFYIIFPIIILSFYNVHVIAAIFWRFLVECGFLWSSAMQFKLFSLFNTKKFGAILQEIWCHWCHWCHFTRNLVSRTNFIWCHKKHAKTYRTFWGKKLSFFSRRSKLSRHDSTYFLSAFKHFHLFLLHRLGFQRELVEVSEL